MISTANAIADSPATGIDETPCNVAHHLPRMAGEAPDRPAVVVTEKRNPDGKATYRSVTFAELEACSNRYANGLRNAGIDRGMRTLVMVRPGVDFVGVIFALFKLGAVPVMIDPGMGVARLLDCMRQVDLHAFIGIPLAHVMRILRPGPFRNVRTTVTVGRRWFWSGCTLDQLSAGASDAFDPTPTRSTDVAAVLFTSGSTGPAKGVVYEHGMFDAQVRLIRDFYGIEPGEVDLPAFPLFVLFSTAMGMTAVIPDMDPSRPARVDPADIVRAIHDHRVTNTFGSPAIWTRVAAYCTQHGIKLPSIKRILIAGAPVPPSVIRQLHEVLSDDADVHTPYGATEALPVTSISGRELLEYPIPSPSERTPNSAATTRVRGVSTVRGDNVTSPSDTFTASEPPARSRAETAESKDEIPLPFATGSKQSLTDRTLCGAGTCVGRPFPDIELRLIRITDDPIEQWSDDWLVPDGEIGELVVAGLVVTKEYFGLPHATALAKIRDGDRIWHRMGDVGYRDADGRIWFCGRKAHRVRTAEGTLFTECCEPIFNQHPEVARTALVGRAEGEHQTPVLVVELKGGRIPRGAERDRLVCELRDLGRRTTATKTIERFVFHRSLPVDVRHNAKINRELLAQWVS